LISRLDRPVLQAESSECAIACLAMISRHFGREVDLQYLRTFLGPSPRGASAKGILRFAKSLSLSGRVLRLELDQLDRLSTPCILHWDLNHFVVLRSVRRRDIIIDDPALGRVRLGIEEVGKHFTGIAIELQPDNRFQKGESRGRLSILQFLPALGGIVPVAVRMLALGLAVEALAFGAPLITLHIIDSLAAGPIPEMIAVLGACAAVLLVLQILLTAARGRIVAHASIRLNLELGGRVFYHLIHLPLVFFERRNLSDIASRFDSLRSIQHTLGGASISAGIDGLMALVSMGALCWLSPELFVVASLMLLVYVITRALQLRSFMQILLRRIVSSAKADSVFFETLRAMQAVRLFAGEQDRFSRWLNSSVELANCEYSSNIAAIWLSTLRSAFVGGSALAVVIFGSLLVARGEMTLGELFAFLSYNAMLCSRAYSFVDTVYAFKTLSVEVDRVADIVLEDREKTATVTAATQAGIPLGLELRQVAFRYSPTDPFLFRDLSVEVSAGQILAVVGRSGVGKTTLVRLLAGLYSPESGDVLINGLRLDEFGLGNYRASIGIVMQDDALLRGTVAENIAFFDPQIDHDRVVEAAHLAQIHEEISDMTMGYDTLLGEMGTGVSGGQKQRIILARALYRRPRLLILDEATSHLDLECEARIAASLRAMEVTRIVIAHRRETVVSAQQVLQLGPAFGQWSVGTPGTPAERSLAVG